MYIQSIRQELCRKTPAPGSEAVDDIGIDRRIVRNHDLGIILVADDFDKGLDLVEPDLIAVLIIVTGHVEVALTDIPCAVRGRDRSLDRSIRAPVFLLPGNPLGAAVGDEPSRSAVVAVDRIRPQIMLIRQLGRALLDNDILIAKLLSVQLVNLRGTKFGTVIQAVRFIVIKSCMVIREAGNDNLRDLTVVKGYDFPVRRTK